jgi:protein tyrosine phosphatase (PTP) superfamily phosphohydrolase (DUF442 family)
MRMSFPLRLPITLFICGLPALAESAPGISNFDRVDANVYRGGQPSPEAFRHLAKLGVRTVVDLREAGSRSLAEQRVVTAAGMKYLNVPMTGLTPPTEAEITRLLGIMVDSGAGPVFVHCKRGADRTGAVIAAYHIVHHRWDNARALKDAEAHRMAFFQFPRKNYIRSFRPPGALDATPPTAAVEAKAEFPAASGGAPAPPAAALPAVAAAR